MVEAEARLPERTPLDPGSVSTVPGMGARAEVKHPFTLLDNEQVVMPHAGIQQVCKRVFFLCVTLQANKVGYDGEGGEVFRSIWCCSS